MSEWIALDENKVRADYAKLVEKYPALKGTENDLPILGETVVKPLDEDRR